MTQDKFRVSEIASDIVDQNVQDFLHENYLDYSYYVIQSRALVHGEGLKPVERRILYSMFTNKCRYNDKTQKAQKIGGTVSGTLHPHSDCLHGDTLFFLSNGKTKKIIDMYRETQKDPTKTYEVYSVNEDGELKLSTLSHARIGQITKEIYKIHLSTGDVVKCTSNHPFMDVNGDFVKAEDLKVGTTLTSGHKVKHDKNPKIKIARSQSERKKWSFDLFEVSKDELFDEIDEGKVVHHKDFNRQNNSLPNLEILTRAEHTKEHKDYLKGFEIGRESMFTNKNPELRKSIKEKNKKIFKIYNENQTYLRARKVVTKMIENNIEINNDMYMKHKHFCYNSPTIETLINKGYIEENIKELPLDAKDLPKELQFDYSEATGITPKTNKKTRRKCDKRNKDIQPPNESIGKVFKEKNILDKDEVKNIKEVQDLLNEGNLIYVTEIEVCEIEKEIPMYDFTVEGYENALIQLADSEKLICLHNSSVTETMARLAQRFSMRIPVIDAEGSVGHTTGDEPAAPRYWEARLSKKGQMLVEEIVDDCVDVVPTYDNESTEPVELPVKWPFSIINGSSGISVGYASKLVPHNPDEVMDACIAYVKNEDITNEELNNYIKGPDFPTGGEIVGVDGIKDYFEKGKGTIIVRGSYEVVPLSRGRNNIIFYELPFEISAETIIKNINKKKDDGLFKEISEVKNLSDIKHPERLVITVKSGGNVDKVIDDIFKYTKAENKISINNTILINDVPEQVDMKTIVGAFIDLRKRVVIKRSENKMKKDKHNAMLLDGLLKVSADIDKAIEIIRQSDNKADANKKLCNKFSINEEQADNVLGLSLGKLTKTDSLEIEDKRRELYQSIEKLEKVLTEQDKLSEIIIEELKETKKAISDPRRTKIHNTTIKELKEQQKEKNKINRLLKKNVKVTVLINRNNELKLSVDNEVLNDCDVINVKSTDNLVGIDKNGMLVSVPVKSISFEQFDPSFSDMIGFGKENPDKEDVGLFIATNKGNVSIIKGELKPDKVGVKLNDDEYIIKAKLITKEEYKKSSVLMISDECKRIRFNMSDISGYNAGAGTISGMNIDGNIIYSDIISEVEDTQNLIVKTNIREIELPVDEFKIQNRAGKGMFLIRLRKNENLKDFSLE